VHHGYLAGRTAKTVESDLDPNSYGIAKRDLSHVSADPAIW